MKTPKPKMQQRHQLWKGASFHALPRATTGPGKLRTGRAAFTRALPYGITQNPESGREGEGNLEPCSWAQKWSSWEQRRGPRRKGGGGPRGRWLGRVPSAGVQELPFTATFLNLLTELWFLEAVRAGWAERLRHTGSPMADSRVLVMPAQIESGHAEGREVSRRHPGACGAPNPARLGRGSNTATGTCSSGWRLYGPTTLP